MHNCNNYMGSLMVKSMYKQVIDSKYIGIPLKIFEDQYVDGALRGSIYFGPIQQYADIERTTGDQVIGDQNEGKIINNIAPTKVWIRSKGENNPKQYTLNKKLILNYLMDWMMINSVELEYHVLLF